jgi:hypothetical protein
VCRIDGAVPSRKGSDDSRGRPIKRFEAWQQGCAVVSVMPDGSWEKEIIPIRNGRAVWRGKEYRA